MAPSLHKRFLGLLLGGAVGDALGAPVEFMSRDEILRRFGPNGITRFAPAYGRRGAITDDTQMTLFTLEGLIRARVRWLSRGICHPASVVDHAYRRWKATQDGRNKATPTLDETQKLDGWLIGVDALWSRRAPGNTCMSALEAKDPGRFGESAKNDSKGAGGIMRVGPVGLYAQDPFRLGCEVAALTHGHITGIVAAGWFAAWIGAIAGGNSLEKAAGIAWDLCRGEAPELDHMLAQALSLAKSGKRNVVPTELGEGWVAEEAAAICLWSVLVTDDPVEALGLAVNIDGDSDTTGSLVGQVLGASLGPTWIPSHFLNDLELRAEIETLADDAIESLSLDPPDNGFVAIGQSETASAATQQARCRFDEFYRRYPGW